MNPRARFPVILAVILGVIACGEVFEPSLSTRPPIAFALAWPTEGSTASATFGAGIDSVYLHISRPNESTAAETTVFFPPGREQLSLEVDIDLTQKVETLYAYMELRDSPSALYYSTAQLILRERVLPAIPAFDLIYVGPGSDAATVGISPRTTFVSAGFSVQYSATAYNGAGQPTPAPIGWSVSDPTLATVDATGKLTARAGANGTLRVRAFTPSGVADSLDVTVSSSPQLGTPPR